MEIKVSLYPFGLFYVMLLCSSCGEGFINAYSQGDLDKDKTSRWVSGTDMPYSSGALTSAVLSNGLHVLGGSIDYDGSVLYQDHYLYNPYTKEWSPSPKNIVDNDVWGIQAQVYNNKIYLIGGWPAGGNRFRVYDPHTNDWNNLESIPNPHKYGFVSAVVEDSLFVIGGRDGGDRAAPVDKYNFTKDIWSSCSPIPKNYGKGSLAGAAWENKIYVINGDEQRGGTTILQIYNTRTDEWTLGPELDKHYEAASAAALDGKIYFFGGVNNAYLGENKVRNIVKIFDVEEEIWLLDGPAMQTGRWRSTVQIIDNKFHLLGGFLSNQNATPSHEVLSLVH